MKIWIAIVIVLIILAAGFLFLFLIINPFVTAPTATSTPASSGAVSSSSGTAVPPPSPAPSNKGTISGTVLLGPTCPVEHNPPLPECAPRPYQTTVRIQPINPSAPYATIATDASGTFNASLDPGTYTLQAQSEANSYYPRCDQVQIEIAAGAAQTTTINCDTGIR